MLRRLLNIASIVCLVLCVALMGMWVRSYCWYGHVGGSVTDTQVFLIETIPGRLHLIRAELNKPDKDDPYSLLRKWRYSSEQIGPLEFQKPDAPHGYLAAIGFDWYSGRGRVSWLNVPFWSLVLTSGLLAMAIQLRWPPQFNLRSLFVVTTFLAVVLGMIAWLDRAWIGK
jgi:hypothetical protein